jgi:AP endonuclease 2
VEDLQVLDAEGRCCITDHGTFVIFNIYAPAITSDDRIAAEERFTYKMRFYEVPPLRSQTALL